MAITAQVEFKMTHSTADDTHCVKSSGFGKRFECFFEIVWAERLRRLWRERRVQAMYSD
jgi:hypothetical protein